MVLNVVVDLFIFIPAELMRSIYRVKEILHSKWGSGAEGTRPQEELTQEADRLLKRALSKCNNDFSSRLRFNFDPAAIAGTLISGLTLIFNAGIGTGYYYFSVLYLSFLTIFAML